MSDAHEDGGLLLTNSDGNASLAEDVQGRPGHEARTEHQNAPTPMAKVISAGFVLSHTQQTDGWYTAGESYWDAIMRIRVVLFLTVSCAMQFSDV